MYKYLLSLASFFFSIQFANASIKIPFRFRGGLIIADFNLNGKVKAPFVFDTGASTTVLDSTAAQALQLKAEGRQTNTGAGGSATFPVVYNQQIQLSKDEVVSLPQCTIVNLQALRERNGENFIGIVGYDILRTYFTYIDFDRKEIILDIKPFTDLGGFSKHPFTFGNGITIPQLTAGIVLSNGTKLEGTVFFDSGASLSLLLNSPFKTTHLAELTGKTISSKVQDLTRENILQEMAIDSIQLGEHKFSSLPISLSSDQKGVSAYNGYMGILGSRVISRFNIVLDYREKVIYLKPNQSYSNPFDFPMSGIRFKKINGRIFVSSIVDGSPAAEKGFKPEQAIVSVDGYKGNDLDKIYKLLQQEGKTVTITISVNGDVRDIELKLQRLL